MLLNLREFENVFNYCGWHFRRIRLTWKALNRSFVDSWIEPSKISKKTQSACMTLVPTDNRRARLLHIASLDQHGVCPMSGFVLLIGEWSSGGKHYVTRCTGLGCLGSCSRGLTGGYLVNCHRLPFWSSFCCFAISRLHEPMVRSTTKEFANSSEISFADHIEMHYAHG